MADATVSWRGGAGRSAALTALFVSAAVTLADAQDLSTDWPTYRSIEFGYEISYPPTLQLIPFFGGSSAELRDGKTRERLVDIELWPRGLCPRQAAGTEAKALGLERAAMVTQADGPDGSSACAKPQLLREFVTRGGAHAYELELTCTEEPYGDECGAAPSHSLIGRKGPTFFVDVSQPWRARVLMLDPVGVDPRLGVGTNQRTPAVARQVSETIAVRPLPKPDALCIEDLR